MTTQRAHFIRKVFIAAVARQRNVDLDIVAVKWDRLNRFEAVRDNQMTETFAAAAVTD